METLDIKITHQKTRNKLIDVLLTYNKFENMLITLIHENYNLYKEDKAKKDFDFLTSPEHIINALYNSKKFRHLKHFKNNGQKLWKDLKEIAKKLNPNNLTYVIKRVKDNLSLYETLEKYSIDPNDPSQINGYSVELDKEASLSLTRLEENLIGIRLSNGLVYINMNKEQIKKLTGINKLHSARVVYNNGDLYLQISYLKELKKTEKDEIKHEIKNKHIKYAGIDIGERNLMAVFIDDETTPSLLVDGRPYKQYDETINQIIEHLNELKSKEVLECETSKTKCSVKSIDKSQNIDKLINFLHTNRNKFFNDQFCKMAKFVVEYLHIYGVTDLFISKNLANHKFTQIELMKLIEAIKHNAQKYEIKVHYVDESFTSKVSCISGNIKKVQERHKLTNASNGKRGKNTFYDTVINERFNADLNAAVNHIIVGTGKSFKWLKDNLSKLKDPIKIKSEDEFYELLEKLKSSKEVKTNET